MKFFELLVDVGFGLVVSDDVVMNGGVCLNNEEWVCFVVVCDLVCGVYVELV